MPAPPRFQALRRVAELRLGIAALAALLAAGGSLVAASARAEALPAAPVRQALLERR